MLPARTSRAPIQSTATIEAKTRKITIADSAARTAMRRRAASNERSTAAPKAARLAASWV